MTPSKYQVAIFNHISDPSKGNLIVQAEAGSGKTTTCEHAIKNLINAAGAAKYGYNVLMCAFNKLIQKEFESRLEGYATAKTLHSIGFGMVPKPTSYWKFNPRSTSQKLYKAFDECPSTKLYAGMGAEAGQQNAETRNQLLGLISLCKNTLVDWNDKTAIIKMAQAYDKDYSELAIQLLPKFMEVDRQLSEKGQIDFDDMIFIPVMWNVRAKVQYTHIFVDEAQDLNRAQIAMLHKILKSGGKIIFVGDPHQAIYGFRGANCDAMDDIKKEFKCDTLPLSICYRCPTSHLDIARKYSPTIEARPDAPVGIVEDIDSKRFIDIVQDGDLCIARKNAPLISYALTCIANRKKAIVLGKEIGENLITIVKNLDCNTIAEANEKLSVWHTNAVDKALRQRKETGNIDDQFACINVLLDGCTDLDTYYNRVQSIFGDTNTTGITFSSVHKAKGLERNRVFIIEPEQIPFSRKDMSEMQAKQELNIALVAYTRSKNELYRVTLDNRK